MPHMGCCCEGLLLAVAAGAAVHPAVVGEAEGSPHMKDIAAVAVDREGEGTAEADHIHNTAAGEEVAAAAVELHVA